MEELFTFNSKQLQRILNPSQEEPRERHFRKRVLSAKPKIIRNISAQGPLQSDRVVRRAKKKVTFNPGDETKPEKDSFDGLCKDRKPLSVVITRKEVQSFQMRSQAQDSKGEKQGRQDNCIRRYAKRIFSCSGRSYKTIEDTIKETTKEDAAGRQSPDSLRRSSKSSKSTAKVMVDMSNQKLPEVFRSKFGDKYLSKLKSPLTAAPKKPATIFLEPNETENVCLTEVQKFKQLLHKETQLVHKWSVKSD